MRVPQVEDRAVALLLSPVTHADHLEFGNESLRHSDNHVVEQGACQSMKGAVFLLITRSLDNYLLTLYRSRNSGVNLTLETALRPGYGDPLTVYLYLSLIRNGNRFLAYARHFINPFLTNT